MSFCFCCNASEEAVKVFAAEILEAARFASLAALWEAWICSAVLRSWAEEPDVYLDHGRGRDASPICNCK